MNKENPAHLLPEQTLLLTETIVKLSALERLLVKSGVITKDELINEIKQIANEISGFVAAQNFEALKIETKN
jgi:hypothetical protein